MRWRDPKYWNGETERERVIRDMLSSRRHALMSWIVVVIQAVALALLGVAFVWLCSAFGE
ncbi:MAG: hypothetical protein IJL17_21700 [Kiritimatiellae bacterium]|nr:hypothetical protein [Kiritimatiellia bacterium]